MNKTNIDIINLLALIISIVGSYLMFYFSRKVDSKTVWYTDADLDALEKKDAYDNKMVRIGMLLLLVGFLLQATAIILGILFSYR